MKTFIAIIIIVSFQFDFAYCQELVRTNYTIKGSVIDNQNDIALENLSVSLLSAKDSILTGTTRTDKEGKFHFSKVGIGNYILFVSSRGYADYIDHFSVVTSKDTVIDLNIIKLLKKSILLTEVVVKTE